MRHIILFSIAAVVLTGVAAWFVTAIQSPKTPTVSQFDPFSLEERAKEFTHSGVARSEHVAE